MGYPTPIEWTDATWNPIGGCSPKSPGCKPCYAQRLAGTRLAHQPLYAGTTTKTKDGKPVFNGKLTAAPDHHPIWTWPVRWRGAKEPKLAQNDPCPPPEAALPHHSGWPSLIFVGDMSDVYHEDRIRAVQDKVVESIVYSRHIGQLLTKRPDVMLEHVRSLYVAHRWLFELQHPLFKAPNFSPEATFENAIVPRLWLGASAERQQEFDERWPYLKRLAEMGFTIFVSYEPAIGPLNLPDDFLALGRRAQLIAGGMSGEDYAPPHPEWFRHARDQCASANVAFFFKQWGEHHPSYAHDHLQLGCEATPDAVHVGGDREFRPSEQFRLIGSRAPGWVGMCKVGKKVAGRQLDGREHNEFPMALAA